MESNSTEFTVFANRHSGRNTEEYSLLYKNNLRNTRGKPINKTNSMRKISRVIKINKPQIGFTKEEEEHFRAIQAQNWKRKENEFSIFFKKMKVFIFFTGYFSNVDVHRKMKELKLQTCNNVGESHSEICKLNWETICKFYFNTYHECNPDSLTG